MKIYFAASITGGRDHAHVYPAIIEALRTHGTVLTEHIGQASLSDQGEVDKTDTFVHDRDMQWVLESDVIVAEVTQTSLGVGYEIGRAVENGKQVLCLYQPQDGKLLTRMLTGSSKVTVRSYTNVLEIPKLLSEYFARVGKKKVLTLVIVEQEGKLLLGQKKRGFGTGKWNGFGGKVEANETIEEGARRELLEEADLGTIAVERRGLLTFHFAGDPVTLEVHVFRVRSFTGTPKETDEMVPHWFTKDAIPYDDMWIDDKYWLPVFLKGKRFEAEFWYKDEKTVERHTLKEL